MHRILLVAVLALAAGCAKTDQADPPATGAPAEAKLAKLTLDEVDRALAAKEARAVDCNPDSLRKRMGVLPGAIVLSDEESYPVTELPADKTTKLVFYCANPG